MNAEPPEAPSAADQRLDEHLDLLREDQPKRGTALAPRIARAARWQSLVRAPLRAAASLLGAAVHGLSILLGGGGRAR